MTKEKLFCFALCFTACWPAAGSPAASELWLCGGEEVEIQPLVASFPASESQRRVFAGAGWAFLPDGRFRFAPSEAAGVSSDVYPVAGTFVQRAGRIELHGARSTEQGGGVTLDGFLFGEGGERRLDLLWSVSGSGGTLAARISQPLRLATPADLQSAQSQIGGLPVPSEFRITLTGQMDDRPFPPLTGILRLVSPHADDPNPIFMSLHTDEFSLPGSVAVSESFVPDAFGGQRIGRIEVRDRDLTLEVVRGANPVNYPSWVLHGVEGLPAWFAQATAGRLELSYRQDRVEGRIDLQGFSAAGGDPRSYQAKFNGERYSLAARLLGEAPPSAPAPALAAEGVWTSQAFSGELRLERAGEHIRGGFAGRVLQGVVREGWIEVAAADPGESGFLRFVAGERPLLLAMLPRPAAADRFEVWLAESAAAPPGLAPTSVREQRWRAQELVAARRYQEAAEMLEQVLRTLHQDPRRATPDVFGDGSYIDEITALDLLAICQFKRGDYKATIESLAAAIVAQDELRKRGRGWPRLFSELSAEIRFDRLVFTDEWRAQFKGNREKIDALQQSQPFYERSIDFLLSLGQDATALVVSEASRARALADILATRAGGARGMSGGGPARRQAVRTPSLEEILDVVRQHGTRVVEYFLGENFLAIWVVDPSGQVKAIRTDTRAEDLRRIIYEVNSLLERPTQELPTPLTPDERRRRDDLLRDLYDRLIAPIPPELQPASLDDVVTIVPHDALFRVAFAALRVTGGEDGYLVHRWSLTYVPSILVLGLGSAEDGGSPSERSLFAVVNPDVSHAPGYGELSIDEDDFSHFSGLFASKATVLTGPMAVESALVTVAGQGVLFFGTHGSSFDPVVKEPVLVLTRDRRNDGYLRIGEISALDLQSELVVLAACQTQTGEITSDGVFSLARGFLVAGAHSVLVTLWTMEQDLTLEQVFRFHQLWLGKGLSKARALQRAQSDMARSNPEQPQFWAGFSLVGQWR
jgi:CHAT domain-containing protein